MVDIVANHMSDWADAVPSFYPFNQSHHYHGCEGCQSACGIDFSETGCPGGYVNPSSVERCRLAGLMDLNQDNDWVASQMIRWLTCAVAAFGFDGVRVDTVPEVKRAFWGKLKDALPDCHFIGEVVNGCPDLVASYQSQGRATPGLPGLLHYPMYYTMNKAFGLSQDLKASGCGLE
jgi:alpha-amylase